MTKKTIDKNKEKDIKKEKKKKPFIQIKIKVLSENGEKTKCRRSEDF